MPSLFVWKATSPLTSTSLTYYSGSNWFLEEHSNYSKSAMYLNQQALSNHGWVYDIKWMPTNWVGSHLLEKISVPYALIKEEALGRVEQLGDWMRYTTYREVDDKEVEWERIQQWMAEKVVTVTVKSFVSKVYSNASSTSYEPCLINLSGHSPISNGNNIKPNKKYHPSRQPRQLYSSHHPHQKRMISS
jgi:hypothetical protein